MACGRQQLQNVWQTIKVARATAAQDVGNEGQTVDYHVDMRHVADVAGSRQPGSVLRRILLAFVFCSFICTGGMWQLPVASLPPPHNPCAVKALPLPFEAAAQQKRAQRERERARASVISTGKATLKRRQRTRGCLQRSTGVASRTKSRLEKKTIMRQLFKFRKAFKRKLEAGAKYLSSCKKDKRDTARLRG